jgi:hypothetical protein
MRSLDPAEFPSVSLFRGFKENGLLKDPADVAARIVDRLVLGPVENGRTTVTPTLTRKTGAHAAFRAFYESRAPAQSIVEDRACARLRTVVLRE